MLALKPWIELIVDGLMSSCGLAWSMINSGLKKSVNLLKWSLWFVLTWMVVPLGSPLTDGVLMVNGRTLFGVLVGLLMGVKVVELVLVGLVGRLVEKSGWLGLVMVGPDVGLLFGRWMGGGVGGRLADVFNVSSKASKYCPAGVFILGVIVLVLFLAMGVVSVDLGVLILGVDLALGLGVVGRGLGVVVLG